MPDWVAPTGFVAICLAIWITIAWRNTAKQINATLDRRPNPTREEFRHMLAGDVSPEASDFLWNTASLYLRLRLTTQPDDRLDRDLPIDDGNWSMDWPRDFAREQGFDEKLYPDWPDGWPVTLRNFGRWLDMAVAAYRAQASIA